MSSAHETNIALFLDFDNIALGVRDARQRFETQVLLQRLLEKGKIVVKRAYADWSHHKEYMAPLHEAGIELIEIPARRMTGKNSADIRLVVDALDLCYSKHHIDTFVIVSGDSDFSPLVSKLRENDKVVIGVGVRNSTSNLLVSSCDEFIFYDDLFRDLMNRKAQAVDVPTDKRKLFDFLVVTARRLLQESRGVLYSSLIKDTMKRKQPDFNEARYGYSTFGDLLEDARDLGLLDVVRDEKAGGTWVVRGLGSGKVAERVQAQGQSSATGQTATSSRKSSRRSGRRRSRGNGRGAEKTAAAPPESAAEAPATPAPQAAPVADEAPAAAQPAPSPPKEAAAPAAPATEAPPRAKKTAKKTRRKTAKKAAKRTSKKTAKKKAKKTGDKTSEKSGEKAGE
jgi:uncharacterized protein (TIGR00288 family)